MTTLALRRVGMLSLIIGAGVLAGCMTSRPPRTFPRATSPNGEFLTLDLANGHQVAGELLAATDTAWYLMVNGRVGSVRAAAIVGLQRGVFDNRAYRWSFPAGEGPSPGRTRDVRDGARFPHGLTPEVLAALLATTSQSAPDDLERPRQ
jgi:hypothetical protein